MSKKKSADQTPHHSLLRLELSGGFLADAKLDFADGLNCFIGGRGAGKTTALELLRFGLGLMPDSKTNPQRHRTLDNLVKSNLGDGQISIELRTKTDMRYTATRTAGESVQVTNENGKAVPISLDRDLIFSADIFSQNEIEEMASSPAAQLALLDRFEEEESLAITRDLEHCHRQLEQSGMDMQRVDQEIDDSRGKASELTAIQERLKGLAEVGGPNAKKLNAAHNAKSLRAREAKTPELLIAAVQKTVREIATATSGLQALIEAHLESALLEGSNQDVFQPLREDVEAFERALTKANATIGTAAHDVLGRLTKRQTALNERHAAQEGEYRTLVAESEEQGGKAAERSALQSALSIAQGAHKEQQGKEKQRLVLAHARRDLLKRVNELRDRRFELRKRTAERLTAKFPTIRVSVTQAKETDEYRGLLVDALKGVGIKHHVTAERIAHAFPPSELAEIVAENDYKKLVQPGKLDEDRARRVVDSLRASGMSYAIEAADRDDRPTIELLDGDQYKESSHLSTGQRCTTILPILLVQSERPLLIDQPEDNLDNAFVYDTIVKALLAVKGGRQVIFVTHNPNIPVLGEAERVFVFESDGQHAFIRQAGTVDECKEQIERILEGGRDAFLQRKKRYGH